MKKKMSAFGGKNKIIPIIMLALLMPSWAMAAPSVTSVNGAVANGQAITISGANFGSGPTVVLFDDFEKGTNGNYILSGANSAQVGQWEGSDGGANSPKYSTANVHSGSLAFRGGATYGSNGIISLGSVNKVFFSYWKMIPSGSSFPTNWKSVWLVGTGTTDHDVFAPAYQGGGVYFATNCCGWNEWGCPSLNAGTWQRMWIYIDSTPSAGIIQQWSLSGSGVSLDVNTSGKSYYSSGSFRTCYVNGYTDPLTCNPTWDDFYIATGDNARARVEIGNASTYAACTNLTMVTPTSWGASSITATVRQGSFGSSSTAYLYVMDSTGAVNTNGYQINFGSGGGDTTPPSAPSGLSVQ